MLKKLQIELLRPYSLPIFLIIFYLIQLQFTHADTLNQSKMQGADIRIFFNNEVMFNEPQWRYGLLDVKLQPNWKTYWKNSGNSGLSPDLQLENGVKAELLFPTPHLLSEGKDWAYTYKDHAQIVFRIAANDIKDKPLRGNLLIGICDTICAPVNVTVLLDNKPSGNFVDKLKIKTAYNALPKAESEFFFVTTIKQENKSLIISIRTPMHSQDSEIFLASKNAQIGVPHRIERAAFHSTFVAPILSGTLSSDDTIEFIVKQEDMEIAGKKKIAKD